MGVVRERESEGESGGPGGAGGGRGGQAAATGALHPKQSMEAGRGLMGREGRPMGRATWEIGPSSLQFPLHRWED